MKVWATYSVELVRKNRPKRANLEPAMLGHIDRKVCAIGSIAIDSTAPFAAEGQSFLDKLLLVCGRSEPPMIHEAPSQRRQISERRLRRYLPHKCLASVLPTYD